VEAQRVKPFEGDIAVEMHFHRADKRRCDVDNLQKLLLDACNGILWKDDSQIVEIKAVLERASDEPGTWMKVWAR
jgi:Holliday junction resolvase RusA-like endonuclease